MKSDGKGGGAKANGGRKIKGEHKDAVFFVDVVLALAVFVAQRNQWFRNPLAGVDKDFAGLGSLGEILLLHVTTFLHAFAFIVQPSAAPLALEPLSSGHPLYHSPGESACRPLVERKTSNPIALNLFIYFSNPSVFHHELVE